MMVRGIRGATTVKRDEEELVMSATEELVVSMAEKNGIDPEAIISVLISTTIDVKAAFPAKAIRSIEGWRYVPVMCMHEMEVSGGLPLCIRILMHVNMDVPQKGIHHIYQHGATVLRPDLQKK